MSRMQPSDNNVDAFQALVPGEGLNHYKDFTASNTYSANLDANTSMVSLFATQDCWCRLVPSSSSDVAAAPSGEGVKGSSFFVPGGITAFFGIPKTEGTVYRVAVVRDTISGRLHISEGR